MSTKREEEQLKNEMMELINKIRKVNAVLKVGTITLEDVQLTLPQTEIDKATALRDQYKKRLMEIYNTLTTP